MRRFREMTTETAGFYNTVGFNDDTRAFLSIPMGSGRAGLAVLTEPFSQWVIEDRFAGPRPA
jgi:glucuronate isomerase